jgi:hypothetical protein
LPLYSPPHPEWLWGQPPIQWVTGVPSLGVKRPGREADHSPPSSAKVKNAWSYTSTPQYAFMAWCLVKHRDTFTFTFTVNTAEYFLPEHHAFLKELFINFRALLPFLMPIIPPRQGIPYKLSSNCLMYHPGHSNS